MIISEGQDPASTGAYSSGRGRGSRVQKVVTGHVIVQELRPSGMGETGTIAALVERLSELADRTGCWRISSDEVAALIGVEPVRFWRTVHGAGERIAFADAIDGWSQDTVGDLVTVLEALFGASPEDELARAGLFMPYVRGIELTEELLFRARRLGAAHEIHTDELEAMLRHTGNVRRAVGIYLDAHVDLEALIEGCAESFRVLQGMPAAGQATAARFLRGMFSRHALDRRSLLIGLEERLRLAAAQLGFMDAEDRARMHGSTAARGGESARRAWARKVLGIHGPVVTPEELRRSYRRMMMRSHPDVDPAGLERCKDVNVAYSLLAAEVFEGS